MELFIGGAYQGKSDYVKETFGFTDEDFCICDIDNEPNFDKKCISHIERFSFWCVKNGIEPKDYFFEHVKDTDEKIIISDDISCGVVPIDKDERAWREANGRLLMAIADKSKHLTRIFCKIPVKIK